MLCFVDLGESSKSNLVFLRSLSRGDRRRWLESNAGQYVFLAPSVAIFRDCFESLSEESRFRHRVLALGQHFSEAMAVENAAASLHRWPDFHDATVVLAVTATPPRAQWPRGVKFVQRSLVEAMEVDGVRVTTPAQTALDIARLCTFPDALAACDLAKSRQLDVSLPPRPMRGIRQARRALRLATDASSTPAISRARAALIDAHFRKIEVARTVYVGQPARKVVIPLSTTGGIAIFDRDSCDPGIIAECGNAGFKTILVSSADIRTGRFLLEAERLRRKLASEGFDIFAY